MLFCKKGAKIRFFFEKCKRIARGFLATLRFARNDGGMRAERIKKRSDKVAPFFYSPSSETTCHPEPKARDLPANTPEKQ